MWNLVCKGTLPDHTCANMAWVSVKTAKSYSVSTVRASVLGTHTWHLPMSMVVHVQSQTQQLPTCLQRNSTISIKNVITSSKRKLLTCVDTIWPDVIPKKQTLTITLSNFAFLYFLFSYTIFLIRTEKKDVILKTYMCVFLFMIYFMKIEILLFCKNFILCVSIFKICVFFL